jgi:hypothetical protein
MIGELEKMRKDAFWVYFVVLLMTLPRVKNARLKLYKKIVYISTAVLLKLKCYVSTKNYVMVMTVKTEVVVHFQVEFQDF